MLGDRGERELRWHVDPPHAGADQRLVAAAARLPGRPVLRALVDRSARVRVRAREHVAEVAPAPPRLHQQRDVPPVGEIELGPVDRPHPERRGRLRELHRARDAVVIGQRHRRVAVARRRRPPAHRAARHRPGTRRPSGRGARRTLRTHVRMGAGRKERSGDRGGRRVLTTLPPRRADSAWWAARGRDGRATGRGGAGEFRRGRVVAARDGTLHRGCPGRNGEGCCLPDRENAVGSLPDRGRLQCGPRGLDPHAIDRRARPGLSARGDPSQHDGRGGDHQRSHGGHAQSVRCLPEENLGKRPESCEDRG